jgi:type I restriction enzyme, S subunit
MSNLWPVVRLGEVLRRSDETVELEPDREYREITVKLWGKGVVLRGVVTGAEVAARRRQIAHADQFILSRIDARNGAFGVVPADLDEAIVSNDFPVFDLNQDRLLPRYLGWLSRTAPFVERCQRASEGTTNRVRISENTFLAIEILLPPLSEQLRVVQRVDELAGHINEARALRQQALRESYALLTARRRVLIGEKPVVGWIPLSKLVAEIENGKSPLCEGRPAECQEWGVLKVGAVSLGHFDEIENKALPVGSIADRRFEVAAGDFLMSRANTSDLVGACVVVENTRRKLLLSDKIFRFRFKEGVPVSRDWLNHVMKSPALREQIVQGATGTSPTMKNISKEKVFCLLVPPHDLRRQERIASEMLELGKEAAALNRLLHQSSSELDALLPSILDRAFKGEI